jgi:hypothetical protein
MGSAGQNRPRGLSGVQLGRPIKTRIQKSPSAALFFREGCYLAQRRATFGRRLNPEIVEPLPGPKLRSQPEWLFPATCPSLGRLCGILLYFGNTCG